MTGRSPARRSPLVLLANPDEWVSRSFASILEPAGYTVARTYNAGDTLARARELQPDAILLDAAMPETDGHALCRALRGDPRVTNATPILLTSAGPSTREQRIAALRAGALGLLGHPVDAEEFLLRLAAYVGLKLEVDRARDACLVDLASGLYSAAGLERRAHELMSQAARERAAVACVVLGLDDETADEAEPVGTHLATTLRHNARVSDAIGRLGPARFAVIAPRTDGAGVVRLAERVVREAGSVRAGAGLHAGYHVIAAGSAGPSRGAELVAQASAAFEVARTRGGTSWIRSSDPALSAPPA